ncbi:MAG: transglutaminase domain-containing protein [Halobacteriovoraceae bacterium]|mgnify:FL=1|jgi:transglutaminase-like putative cysteine protease|nr:transglutaminase domain-containing protein [Halobacteriovoraceae bacterium]MBT5093416.1 transglutaminase domain-containing protein [Halobacteriovoraceae bacterium]
MNYLNRLILLICFTAINAQAALHPVNKWKEYELKYNVTIPKPEIAFQDFQVWIPVPQNTEEQKLVSQEITGANFSINEGIRYGNKMAYFDLSKQSKFPIKLKATWKVKRRATGSIRLSESELLKFNNPKNFLGISKKVPINGVIAELAMKATNKSDSKWTKIEKMYDHVVAKMSYDKSGKGWGQGDAIWACDAKRGNCTDFHSLLVGMARSQGIPAQFQIGLPTPPSGNGKIPGYHCWARVFDQEKGWFPVDASESKKAKSPRKYFGSLPANRIHFTTGRDLVLSPKQNGEALNYFIYPYLELDGKKYQKYEKAFSVKTL